MSRTIVDPGTLGNLELGRVLACIAARAASGPGRSLALALGPDIEPDARAGLRGLGAEMGRITAGGLTAGPGAPDLSFLDDLEPLFHRLERGGMLEGEDVLRAVAPIAPAIRLQRIVAGRREAFPALSVLLEGSGLGSESDARRLEQLDLEVASTLEPDGTVKDSASPELRRLRRRARDLRSRLSARARRLVEKHAAHLMDSFFTLRDDRYVLPVRSDARASIRGIIHDSSNTGSTLFIEPDVLVDDCNELKVIEGETQAREREVLLDLSRLLMARVPALRPLGPLLARVDLAMAIALFARDAGAVYPELVDEPVLGLVGVRHPMLALAGGPVVPNDVDLRAGQCWVVSGPNAGGKTVLLKAVGLAVLMARTGLPVTSGRGSVVGGFAHVRAEIGDAQSVEGNLSTFSAQVSSLARILEDAGPDSLLVLDELAAGTDPDEGAVLAQALIEAMLDRGSAVILATHFEPLKKLSITGDRLVAAGMGLDLESLEPTYRLHVGMPGTSGGLLVAERYGLPANVVARARQILEGGGGPEEGRLQAIERLRRELDKRLAEAESLESTLRSKQVTLETRERQLMDDQRRRMQAEQRYLATELTVLRGELKHAHRVLRRRPVSDEDVRKAEKIASRVGRAIAPGGPVTQLARDPVPARPLGEVPVEGQTVYVDRLDLEGVVERVEGDRVRIRRGAIAWTVDLADVARPARTPAPPAGGHVMEEKRDPLGDEQDESVQTAYNTIDLRGRGLDEAQIDVDAFLDQALEMGIETVFVIHGHGKGVLKTGLRRYLRHLRKVESFRPGQRGEGGDGVTVCKLRSVEDR